jgi:hypothetical protein
MAWPGHELREYRSKFLARAHGDRFLGYLRRQRDRMLGSLSQRTNRPELVAKYGIDTKFAYHALRIALQGIQLMETGEIVLPMHDEHREWLLNVRNGAPGFNKRYIISRLAELEEQLASAIGDSKLPDHVDYEWVNRWMVHVYREWWDQHRQMGMEGN